MKAAPVASSLGLVSVPSDVVREGQVAGNMVTAKGAHRALCITLSQGFFGSLSHQALVTLSVDSVERN